MRTKREGQLGNPREKGAGSNCLFEAIGIWLALEGSKNKKKGAPVGKKRKDWLSFFFTATCPVVLGWSMLSWTHIRTISKEVLELC